MKRPRTQNLTLRTRRRYLGAVAVKNQRAGLARKAKMPPLSSVGFIGVFIAELVDVSAAHEQIRPLQIIGIAVTLGSSLTFLAQALLPRRHVVEAPI